MIFKKWFDITYSGWYQFKIWNYYCMSAHFNIFRSFGFGIGFGRNKNIFSVYVSVSAKKKNGCFG